MGWCVPPYLLSLNHDEIRRTIVEHWRTRSHGMGLGGCRYVSFTPCSDVAILITYLAFFTMMIGLSMAGM